MYPSEILEKVSQVLNFTLFRVKETPVTLFSLIMFFVVLAIFIVLSKILRKIFFEKVLSRLAIDKGTSYSLNRITHYIILLIGALVSFQFINIDLSGLVVIFGLLSVGIGFGLQNITSNFISGLILLFERPIKVGDRVTVGEIEGDVSEINIRSTTIRSLNNISIIVPNSEFVSAKVINWSHKDPKVKITIKVGVSYNSNLELVLQSLKEVALENPVVLDRPAPEILFRGFGDSSWNMELRIWILDPKQHLQVQSDINCEIVRKFRKYGVEIPFPQRDLHVRSPLPVPLSSIDEKVDNA